MLEIWESFLEKAKTPDNFKCLWNLVVSEGPRRNQIFDVFLGKVDTFKLEECCDFFSIIPSDYFRIDELWKILLKKVITFEDACCLMQRYKTYSQQVEASELVFQKAESPEDWKYVYYKSYAGSPSRDKAWSALKEGAETFEDFQWLWREFPPKRKELVPFLVDKARTFEDCKWIWNNLYEFMNSSQREKIWKLSFKKVETFEDGYCLKQLFFLEPSQKKELWNLLFEKAETFEHGQCFLKYNLPEELEIKAFAYLEGKAETFKELQYLFKELQYLFSKIPFASSKVAKIWLLLGRKAKTFEEREFLRDVEIFNNSRKNEVWSSLKEQAETFNDCARISRIRSLNKKQRREIFVLLVDKAETFEQFQWLLEEIPLESPFRPKIIAQFEKRAKELLSGAQSG